MERTRKRIIVATDSTGRILAAALPGDGGEVSTGLEAIDGQIVHEIEVPQDLESLESPHAVLAAISDGRVSPKGELKLAKTRLEK